VSFPYAGCGPSQSGLSLANHHQTVSYSRFRSYFMRGPVRMFSSLLCFPFITAPGHAADSSVAFAFDVGRGHQAKNAAKRLKFGATPTHGVAEIGSAGRHHAYADPVTHRQEPRRRSGPRAAGRDLRRDAGERLLRRVLRDGLPETQMTGACCANPRGRRRNCPSSPRALSSENPSSWSRKCCCSIGAEMRGAMGVMPRARARWKAGWINWPTPAPTSRTPNGSANGCTSSKRN
jgi:hypothetical protein